MGAYAGPDIVKNGLIMCLDAANTQSYPGSGTLWTDISGHGNHATFTNLATHVTGSHFSFDGIDDYATVDSGLETTIDGLTELTITGLVNYRFFEHVDNIIGWGNANATGDPATSKTLGFYNHSGTLKACYNSSASFGTSATMVNKWVFLVSRYTTSNIYADMFGEAENSTTHTLGTNPTWLGIDGQGYSITIGKTSYFARYAECYISALQVYNRKITDAEMKQNFNAYRGRFGI